MNNKARNLGMQKTTYANSHGLVNSANKSCAYDLAILCEYAMANNKFREIVSCCRYQTKITFSFKKNLSKKSSMKKIVKKQKIEEEDKIEEDQEKDLDSNSEDEDMEKGKEYEFGEKMIEW